MPTMHLYIVAVILWAQDGLVKAADSKMNSQTEANLGFKGPAHGVKDGDKPDSSDAIGMLSDEMKKVMDIEDGKSSVSKFVPIFPMMTLSQIEYEPAPGGIINSNFQANMARLTDALHVDPLGGGISDPGDYNEKLSNFANKVLEYAKPVDADAMKKALQCFETQADQIVNDLQLSRTIKSAMAKCAEEKVQGMKQYNRKFAEAREDCNERIAGNVIQQAEQKEEVLKKIQICKSVEAAATGGENEVSPCGLKAIMDSSLDDKEKRKAAGKVKLNKANCIAEAKQVTMEFQNQVAHSMATCRNLVRVRNFALEVIRSRCDPEADGIATKLATIGKYRDQLSFALHEHDGYSESWARSSTQPDTIHDIFMDAHELDANGIIGGPEAGWMGVTKLFEKSENSESKSSVSVTASGSVCYMGIVCVEASAAHSKEDAQADSKNMKQLVSFKIRPLVITHSWFPFNILNDDTFLSESYAKHSWHIPDQWDEGAGWSKNRKSSTSLLAYRSKIIFCKDIRVSITSGSSSEMKTIKKTKAGGGVRLPMLGASVRTDVEKTNEESNKKDSQGGIHLIVDGVGICGYVLTQISNKALPIKDGTTQDDDKGRKKEKAQQKERFDKAFEKLKIVDEELKNQQEDLDPTGSAYSGNKAEL